MGTARAQTTPVFSLKVTGIFDSNFSVKLCPSCGFGPGTGATELPLGEALPGDILRVQAFAFNWDANTLDGLCTTGSTCRTDLPNSCTTRHCSDNDLPCAEGEGDCNPGASCLLDTCLSDPSVGSFQWTLNTASLHNDGPGTFSLSELPCNAESCLACQEDPLNQGGPGGTCDLCSCFHYINFACFGFCTCCDGGLGDLSCPAETGICKDSSTAFIELSHDFWLLQSTNPTVAISPNDFTWIGAAQGGIGAPQGAFPSYMGTVFLTIPECATGRFEINFADDDDKSFLNDASARKLLPPLLEPLIVNLSDDNDVGDPCVGVFCDDGDPCTLDTCDNSSCNEATCLFDPVVCEPADWVCNPSNGICEDVLGACCPIDPADACKNSVDAACDRQGWTFQGIGSRCEDAGVCDAQTACTTLIAEFPPNCAIDARQPSTINGLTQQGWNSIDINVGPSGCLLSAGDLELLSDGVLGISSVSQVGAVATVTFDSIIPTEHWTCLSLFSDASQQVCVGFLPGDVDNDGAANPALDLGAEIDCLNNPGTCPDWRTDIDRDGPPPGVLDLTRVIDLFNGAGSFLSWTGANLGSSCPSR